MVLIFYKSLLVFKIPYKGDLSILDDFGLITLFLILFFYKTGLLSLVASLHSLGSSSLTTLNYLTGIFDFVRYLSRLIILFYCSVETNIGSL